MSERKPDEGREGARHPCGHTVEEHVRMLQGLMAGACDRYYPAPPISESPPPVYRDVAERMLATLREIGASPDVVAIAERVAGEAIDRPEPGPPVGERAGGGAGPTLCADCDTPLDPGEAKVFTVCERCWDKTYRRPPEPSPSAEGPGPARTCAKCSFVTIVPERVLCPRCGSTSWVPEVNAGAPPATTEPLPMVLHCPRCGKQHIDEPRPEKGWTNPPHRSHECQGCGTVWRPADVPTTGVASITTRGTRDSWPVPSKVCPQCGGDTSTHHHNPSEPPATTDGGAAKPAFPKTRPRLEDGPSPCGHEDAFEPGCPNCLDECYSQLNDIENAYAGMKQKLEEPPTTAPHACEWGRLDVIAACVAKNKAIIRAAESRAREEARERQERAIEALQFYGRHTAVCDMNTRASFVIPSETPLCTCGLEQAIIDAGWRVGLAQEKESE